MSRVMLGLVPVIMPRCKSVLPAELAVQRSPVFAWNAVVTKLDVLNAFASAVGPSTPCGASKS